jgi:ABC-type phosphate transport system substrate-binding protein
MRKLKLAAAALALGFAAPALAEEAFKVIAHPEVAVEAIARTQLSDIFLKRATTWPGGAKVVPVDLGADTKAFEAFCQGIHGKPGSLIRSFWKRVAATGRDTPPAVRGSDDDVTAFVRSTPGAVGYVSATAAATGVKVLRVGN